MPLLAHLPRALPRALCERVGDKMSAQRQYPMLCFRAYLAGPVRRPIGATYNEGPYLRPSSQRSWMEEMRAHQRCAAIVLLSSCPHTVWW